MYRIFSDISTDTPLLKNKVYERAWLGGEFLNARKTWFQPELQNFAKNNLAVLPKNFSCARGVYVLSVDRFISSIPR